MTMRSVAAVVGLGLVAATATWSIPPMGGVRGEVRDASTGKAIRGVMVHSFHDATGQEVESVSDSSGSYGTGVGNGAIVVYCAYGYRAVALRWPEELSPSDAETKRGLTLRVVALEPRPLPKR